MDIVLLWLGLSIVVWVAASSKGRFGFGWFLLSIVVSPLIAGLLVLVLPSRRVQSPQAVNIVQAPQTQGSALKKCPECAEVVQADARICRFCRHEFYPAQSSVRQPDPNFRLPPIK